MTEIEKPKMTKKADKESGIRVVDNRSVAKGQPQQSEIQVQIGRQLRTVYDDVLNQPIPDRFMELLQKLDTPKK
ncbi:NepR family anti-sigma factor [Terripilifer ovatus]|uniref:NepR family anti-sigma factor n=1 Tax=Terripilifer ovatus TaxID=3032367 RepID=UPI003AB95DB6